MAYHWLTQYRSIIFQGLLTTLWLTACAAILGLALATVLAWVRVYGVRAAQLAVAGYVEIIRNTPFLVQLFFLFFGLPGLGVRLSATQAAIIMLVLNLGAYSSEIIRAGIDATPAGQVAAGMSLGMTRYQVFRYVILVPALQRIWPALTSQMVIFMLGTSVVSQIGVPDITYAISYIQSRNLEAFQTYFTGAIIYFVIAAVIMLALRWTGRRLFNNAWKGR